MTRTRNDSSASDGVFKSGATQGAIGSDRQRKDGARLRHRADVIVRPRVLLPRLRDVPLRHFCREFHAFANARTEPRPTPLDEFSVIAPDLARLDHTEALAPAVKTVGSHTAASSLR